MSGNFIGRLENWKSQTEHELKRHWWGLGVLFLVGLFEHRFFEAANRFVDAHGENLDWLKPLSHFLASVPRFYPITSALELFLLGLLGLLAHAYWTTRSQKTATAEPQAIPPPGAPLRNQIFEFSDRLSRYVIDQPPRPSEDEAWTKSGGRKDDFANEYAKIQDWDNKLCAGYWLNFRDPGAKLRHELALSGIVDSEIDKLLMNLDTEARGQHHLWLNALAERFRLQASKLSGKQSPISGTETSLGVKIRELYRSPTDRHNKSAFDLFLKVRIELTTPANARIEDFRFELLLHGVTEAMKPTFDLHDWELCEWKSNVGGATILSYPLVPLSSELRRNEPIDGWLHFVCKPTTGEMLERCAVRLIVQTDEGSGYHEHQADPLIWNPRKGVNISRRIDGALWNPPGSGKPEKL